MAAYTYNADTKTWTDQAGKPVEVTVWDLIREVNLGGASSTTTAQITSQTAPVPIQLSSPQKGLAYYFGIALIVGVTAWVVKRGMA